MLIDCDTCAVRGPACDDCVVGVLLRAAPAPPGRIELDGQERAALAVLAGAGMVPPLRLVPPPEEPGQPGPRGQQDQPEAHQQAHELDRPEEPPGRVRSA